MAKAKVSKFFDGRRLVVCVRTSDFEEAKTIANEIFKIRKKDLIASNAIVKGNSMLYDGGFTKEQANAVAVFRITEE